MRPYGYKVTFAKDLSDLLGGDVRSYPDLLVIVHDPPAVKGFEVLRLLRLHRQFMELPVLFVLREWEQDGGIRAYNIGADEVVDLTCADAILRAKVRVLVRLAAYRRRLLNERRMLRIKLERRTRELMEITIAMVGALEKATELSDPETGHHVLRVAGYSALLAEGLGLRADFVQKVRLFAPLHDVGKVGIPDSVLKKPGPLTPEEFEEMKKHTIYGYELLKAARADAIACNIAMYHHERMDGSGYPRGLKGRNIPVEARIVAVSDCFDAMTSPRRYKESMAPAQALRLISVELEERFDRAVVSVLLKRFKEVLDIFNSYR